MSDRKYKLPDGKLTSSANEYIDSWEKLAEPVEILMVKYGWKLDAFQPDLRFDQPGTPSRVHHVSVELAREIGKVLAELDAR